MFMSIHRMVVLGAGGVGKSALVHQYLKEEFLTSYTPTVEDLHLHYASITDTTSIFTEILDTAGLHRFPAMRELAIKSGQAYMVVYAVNSMQSFEEAMTIVNMIHSIKNDLSCPMLLVGNKADLAETTREVPFKMAAAHASELGCEIIEMTATSAADVTAVFNKLLHKLHGLDIPYNSPARRRSIKQRLMSLFGNGQTQLKEATEDVESELELCSNFLERRSIKNPLLRILRRRRSCNNNILRAVPVYVEDEDMYTDEQR